MALKIRIDTAEHVLRSVGDMPGIVGISEHADGFDWMVTPLWDPETGALVTISRTASQDVGAVTITVEEFVDALTGNLTVDRVRPMLQAALQSAIAVFMATWDSTTIAGIADLAERTRDVMIDRGLLCEQGRIG